MKGIGSALTAGMIQSNSPTRIAKPWGTLLVFLLFCLPVYGQPANDEAATATAITSIPFTDNVNTTTATSNPADPSLSCNGSGAQTDGNTVWYVWTPPADIAVIISTAGSTQPGGSPLDTAHGVFTGTVGALTEVACVDIGLTDDLFFEATGGVTYYLKFGEFLNGVGGGNLVVTVDLPPPPEQLILESISDGLSAPISSLASALAERAAKTSSSLDVVETPLFMRDEGNEEALGKNGASTDRLRNKADLLRRLSPDGIQSTSGSSQMELLQIFDGAENDDNAFTLGILVAPPDVDGDVGPNHYVQMINDLTTIFDKSGNVVLGPFANNVFWAGLGSLCEFTNRGDPVVLYDEETDRWLISQFALNSSNVPPWSLCIAISTTGDPTGSYYQHEFDFSGIGFPDYPKYGFVTDAIGVMVNLFNPFQGAGLGAIDKAEAFSAGPTTMVFYKPGANEFGFVVGDNDGPVFDNMPPTFATNNGGSGNRIDFWEIHPDFVTPANSTISEVARIPVSPFDSDLCNAFREQCIDQPGSGTGAGNNFITFFEAISDRLMHRLQLRNFGNDKRAVVTHTVDADGNGKAGKRWYEFRNHKDKGWKLFEENTFSPDGDHRWMGSIAMNTLGETSLGYSISSSTTYPSIGVAGRRGASSFMNLGELVVFDGNVDQHVQRRTARWGDYSAMTVDPVDGTFWYTQEYAKPNSFIGEQFGWATKIVQIGMTGGPTKLAGNVAASKNSAEGDALQEVITEVPAEFALAQNYPNPFNPATTLTFGLPEESDIRLIVYDVMGRQVGVLAEGTMPAGEHRVTFDATGLPSGLYLARLTTPQGAFTRTMQLVK